MQQTLFKCLFYGKNKIQFSTTNCTGLYNLCTALMPCCIRVFCIFSTKVHLHGVYPCGDK